jgi:DNA-binding NarL/FixJ family response regulator
MVETSILLADDQVLCREAVRALIDQQDGMYVIGEASDGEEALKLAAELKPDILATELCLPRLSGAEVAHRIRKAKMRTRVLVLTSSHGRAAVEDCVRAGASAFVSKEDSSPELIHAIKALSHNKTYLSPTASHYVVGSMTNGASEEGRLSQLTSREREVLQLVAEGMSSKEIAAALNLSTRTVETHRAHAMDKLGIHKVSSLVRFAIREGLIKA